MTRRSAAQVDKDAHRRRMGVKVEVLGKGSKGKGTVPLPRARTVEEVDKDILRRRLGIKVPPRGRLSDAATGRLTGKNKGGEAAKMVKGARHYDRDRKGRFA